MKHTNQFDYPSKQVQTFKVYSKSQAFDIKNKTIQNKTRYKQSIQYHMQIQRNKVKQTQKKMKQKQSKINKVKLQVQLQKKLKQLQKLQILKQHTQENQRKSYQLAIIKQQQVRIKKQEDEKRKQQFDENAMNRFGQAMKRLQQQREQILFKDKLAEQRRKTTDDFQRIQRIKAGKYKAYIQQKQKNKDKQQTKQFYQYNIKIGNPTNESLTDYNKTCFHNLKIVPAAKNGKQNAFQRGLIMREEFKQKSQEKERKRYQNTRKSMERGNQALLKLKGEKQYQEFYKESQQQQKRYNLNRIQVGKKNQFIGVKPTTLSQMQINKKLRSQQQFDAMFFSNQANKNQNFSKNASKFQVLEARLASKKQEPLSPELPQVKNKLKRYIKQKQQSQIPCHSEGTYSFQQPEYSQFKNHSKSQSNINQESPQYQNQQQVAGTRDINQKNCWKQTGISNQKHNTFLEQQRIAINPSSQYTNNLEQKHINHSKSKNNEQNEPFNTDQMLKKYGLKHDYQQQRNSRNNAKSSNKQQNKRKVVELANICQNKQQEKQQLSYSSQSQEDSLM